nr:nucleoside triphosphate pyrophosphohydrolase family protein [uncultured Cellulosilyticum sp.]
MVNYWSNICKMQQKQTQKGIEKYGQILEENLELSWEERLTYLQEELIDGLMYLEHAKTLKTTISPDEYQIGSLRTIPNNFTKKDMLLNGALGLSGEAGEVVDIIKKHIYQGHELNKVRIKEELGDVMWYVSELCNAIGIKLSDVMETNIAKLKERYPNGFEANRSINRNNK